MYFSIMHNMLSNIFGFLNISQHHSYMDHVLYVMYVPYETLITKFSDFEILMYASRHSFTLVSLISERGGETMKCLQSSFHFFKSHSYAFEVWSDFRRFMPAILDAATDVLFAIEIRYWRTETLAEEPLWMDYSLNNF